MTMHRAGRVAGGTPPRERGAALVVVLSLLVASSMISLSSLQSSLLQERMAGNHRASVQAQMAAESAVATLKSYVSLGQEERNAEWPGLEDSHLDLALAKDPAVLPLAPCVDDEERAALWADSDRHVVLSFNVGTGQASSARLAMCNGDDNTEIAVLGLAGNAAAPARYPATVQLSISSEGLATTNFIGGIDDEASIQWPTSENSRLDGGANGQAIYFDHLSDPSHAAYFETLIAEEVIDDKDYVTRNKTNLIASMGNQTDKIVDGIPAQVITAATPDREQLDSTMAFIKAIYDTCAAAEDSAAGDPGSQPGKGNNKEEKGNSGKDKDNKNNGGGPPTSSTGGCDNIRIVPPGADKNDDRLAGNETFNGLYIDLSGKLDIRGNSQVQGAVVVANVTIRDDGSWAGLPNHTIKLAGGGNSGSVWYNALNLAAAIQELKSLDPQAFADLELETFWGAGGSSSSGWSMPGWLQPAF